MALTVDEVLAEVVRREGGFVNHPADRGGPTKFGITQVTLGKYRGRLASLEDVRALTREEALAIYRARFVEAPGFDRLQVLAPLVAAELVDTGVNMGPEVAGTFLQRCLNALNLEERLFPDLEVDGRCGPVTRTALAAYLERRRSEQGEAVLVRALNALQGCRYIEIAESRPSQEAFLFGWLRHRVA